MSTGNKGHYGATALDALHTKIGGVTEGGACLTGHEPNFRLKQGKSTVTTGIRHMSTLTLTVPSRRNCIVTRTRRTSKRRYQLLRNRSDKPGRFPAATVRSWLDLSQGMGLAGQKQPRFRVTASGEAA